MEAPADVGTVAAARDVLLAVRQRDGVAETDDRIRYAGHVGVDRRLPLHHTAVGEQGGAILDCDRVGDAVEERWIPLEKVSPQGPERVPADHATVAEQDGADAAGLASDLTVSRRPDGPDPRYGQRHVDDRCARLVDERVEFAEQARSAVGMTVNESTEVH